MTTAHPYRWDLPPAARLRQSRDFVRLRESGRRTARRCFVANWRVQPTSSRSRVGVVASRRLGPAVARNRAKRLLREVFRLSQERIDPPVDLVLVARSPLIRISLGALQQEFHSFLREARLSPHPS